MPEYVILAASRGDPEKKLLLSEPDRTSSGSFWTFKITEAKIYNDLRAAESRKAFLKFGDPVVITVEEAVVIIQDQKKSRAETQRRLLLNNPVLPVDMKRRQGDK